MLVVVWVSLLFYISYSRQNHELRIQENKNGKILITVEDQSFFKTYFYCGWNKIEIKHYFAALVSDSDRNHSCFAFYQLFFSHRSTSTQQRSVWRRKIVFNIQQDFPLPWPGLGKYLLDMQVYLSEVCWKETNWVCAIFNKPNQSQQSLGLTPTPASQAKLFKLFNFQY